MMTITTAEQKVDILVAHKPLIIEQTAWEHKDLKAFYFMGKNYAVYVFYKPVLIHVNGKWYCTKDYKDLFKSFLPEERITVLKHREIVKLLMS